MPNTINESEQRWGLRLARVDELLRELPDVPGLPLYRAVLQFQAELARRFRPTVVPDLRLRNQIDIEVLSGEVPSILDLSAKYGTELLRSEAMKISEAGEEAYKLLLRAGLAAENSSLDAVKDFLSRACLQPVAENLQLQLVKTDHYIGSVCPTCGGLPQAAVLRPEGEGAGRSLLCSFCFDEWAYRRVICAWCGEEDKERLPRFSAEEFAHMHVEACDTCKRYLKAVDLSVNGLAVPLVDEAAAAVLDVWAAEHGYTKIIRNLIGF